MRRFVVAEESMAPALRPGDYLVATRLRRPRRGDIVVFPHPHRSGFWLVKRIVGLPGERVTVAAGRVTVDGDPLPPPLDLPTPGTGTWTVDEDAVFVLSDARTRTRADSRGFGPVPAGSCHRVTVRYWPLRRMRRW